jgi:hypothetical protein
MGLLECKGTRSPGYATKQLASGIEQLAGLLVDSRSLRGLVVSSVVADDEIRYLAIASDSGSQDLTIGLDSAQAVFEKNLIATAESSEREFLEVQIPAFSSADEARSDRLRDEVDSLAAVALATSWASIADLSGNDLGVRRWSSPETRDRAAELRRPRQEFARPNGAVVRGVSNVVTLPGGRLESVLGVLDFVDDALSSGDSVEISEAQGRAAAMESPPGTVDDVVEAYGDDGSALLLRPI